MANNQLRTPTRVSYDVDAALDILQHVEAVPVTGANQKYLEEALVSLKDKLRDFNILAGKKNI